LDTILLSAQIFMEEGDKKWASTTRTEETSAYRSRLVGSVRIKLKRNSKGGERALERLCFAI